MKRIFAVLSILAFLFSCGPKSDKAGTGEFTSEQDQKMEWWREARFGMFIHWGLYAIPAGEWNGQYVPGISEWIMARAEIPVKEYEKLAEQFNPVNFDAEAWVKLAKKAGMKYIVITSKHHDGFAMFHSKVSPYNIVDATPFDRDPLKELADACKKQDMKLGFYYSQAQDWHEPGGTYRNIERGIPHWDKDLQQEPLMNYVNGKALPQLKEILENYGGLDILWWDTPIGMTEEAAKVLKAEADKYPDMITNNRLYRPWPGDFTTPEQRIPPTGLSYDWEVCMTMNTSWGFKHYDSEWKSTKTLLHNLVDIASKGGNFLLNVGPTSLGEIPGESQDRLKEIGIWMQQYGESIYGTSPSPFFKLPWGRCTTKETEKGQNYYFHVFDWPKTGMLEIPGFKARVSDVYLLSHPKHKFAWRFEEGNMLIGVPSGGIDPINTVLVVQTKGKVNIESNMPTEKDGSILLTAEFGDIHNPGYGDQASLVGTGKKAYIGNWKDQRTRLEWFFKLKSAGTFRVEALIRSTGEGTLNLEIGESKMQTKLKPTGEKFDLVELGKIDLFEVKDHLLSLKSERGDWSGVDVMYVELVRE